MRAKRAVKVAFAIGFMLLASYVQVVRADANAHRWLAGDEGIAGELAAELIAFETKDDESRRVPSGDRFAGEWALVTHQMTALGLAQIALAHPAELDHLAPEITRAARKSFLPEMRGFGTDAWSGEDVMASLAGSHGHAYMAYPALAVGMARLLDPAFPPDLARQHDALIAAFERRLLASPSGLIETYPGEAYPTDTAAVAAAIAVHGRVTHTDHGPVLAHWSALVRKIQIDPASGYVFQRMGARDGRTHDAPRGSGTGLAAYFAGFADRSLARDLAAALMRHESTVTWYSAIQEFAAGHAGTGDVDSGPTLFGVSVAATGFGLGAARAHGYEATLVRLYRTTELFGVPVAFGGTRRFLTGGAIGNALLLAMLTSGPELAPPSP